MHSKTDIENVYLMAAGPIPPNPAELLEPGNGRGVARSI